MMSSKNHKALSDSPCSTSKGCDISTKTTKWKDDASTLFTSKGCDIGRGDARRVDTQKIL